MKEPSYVAEVIGHAVLVRVLDSRARSLIRGLGGKRCLFPIKTWRIRYRSDNDLAVIMASLRDCGFPFGSGRQWPPCDVFEDLRARGLLCGKYEKIFWHGPGNFEVMEA